MKRYKVAKVPNKDKYVIMDRLKLKTSIREKRYTKRVFDSVDVAFGFMFGRGKLNQVKGAE